MSNTIKTTVWHDYIKPERNSGGWKLFWENNRPTIKLVLYFLPKTKEYEISLEGNSINQYPLKETDNGIFTSLKFPRTDGKRAKILYKKILRQPTITLKVLKTLGFTHFDIVT
jgi:hypothetical protein